MSGPVVLRGVLGWGNRKGGYEAYGPGGRWAPATTANKEGGDLLGDALEHAGAHEGATLLVIAVDRFGDTTVLDEIEAMVAGVAAGPQTTPPVLAEHITVLPVLQTDGSIVHLWVDVPPGTRVRVVAAPTGQEDP